MVLSADAAWAREESAFDFSKSGHDLCQKLGKVIKRLQKLQCGCIFCRFLSQNWNGSKMGNVRFKTPLREHMHLCDKETLHYFSYKWKEMSEFVSIFVIFPLKQYSIKSFHFQIKSWCKKKKTFYILYNHSIFKNWQIFSKITSKLGHLCCLFGSWSISEMFGFHLPGRS